MSSPEILQAEERIAPEIEIMLSEAQAFDDGQLTRLENHLDTQYPTLAILATRHFVGRIARSNARIRGLATSYASDEIGVARARLAQYSECVLAGKDLDDPDATETRHAPRDLAALAAGHIAMASLVATWYGLKQADYQRLPRDCWYLSQGQSVRELVIGAPAVLDISSVSPRRLFLTASRAVSADPGELPNYTGFIQRVALHGDNLVFSDNL